MNSSNDLIRLAQLDGHGMYDRFEVIRAIIVQATEAATHEEILMHYAEILLNMMLMKISLYLDQHTDSLHFFNDYQQFLAYIKDATDYITERYKELADVSMINQMMLVELIANHYEEYISQHDPT